MSDLRFYAVCVLGVVALFAIMIVFAEVIDPQEEDRPPYGCVWYDMNPSKGADYQLACVPGYPKEGR